MYSVVSLGSLWCYDLSTGQDQWLIPVRLLLMIVRPSHHLKSLWSLVNLQVLLIVLQEMHIEWLSRSVDRSIDFDKNRYRLKPCLRRLARHVAVALDFCFCVCFCFSFLVADIIQCVIVFIVYLNWLNWAHNSSVAVATKQHQHQQQAL